MNTLVILLVGVLLIATAEYWIYLLAKLWFPGHTRALRSELWWTTSFISAPIALLNGLWAAIQDFAWYDPIALAFNVLAWWFFIVKDNDKDDRWKKRRKKALARVKEVAGKLVVVPLPSPA